MGNSLPKNPTPEQCLVYAGKISKSKPEEAVEIYMDISRNFRLEKRWDEAVNVLILCSKLQQSVEKAKTYIDIANLYQKLELKDNYMEYLKIAITEYGSHGSFSNCGRYSVTIAEEYENSLDYKNALEYYTHAVDYYEKADMENNYKRYMAKMAMLSAYEPSTTKASIDMFEKLAHMCSENKLLMYHIPGHLFNAGLCLIFIYSEGLDSFDNTRCAIESYSEKFPIFYNRREAKFLSSLLTAVHNKDINDFTSLVMDYDSISTIDDWSIGMTLKIKKNITENDLR